MLHQGLRPRPAIREKMAVGTLLSGNYVPSPWVEIAAGNGMEPNIPRELMLVAALRGGGDPNETIYQSWLHRCGACRLGDGGIRNATRSRKRDGH
jgi:hypothetical protein